MIRSTKLILGVIIILIVLLLSIGIVPFFVATANQDVYKLTQIHHLHHLGLTGKGITIGMIDTGVDQDHQEFSSTNFVGWHDLIHNQTQSNDDADHGTHLAGLLIAQGTLEGSLSGIHLQGIIPEAQLLVVKAISQADQEYGTAQRETIAQAITYCLDHDVDIILLTLGKHPEKILSMPYEPIQSACEQAMQQGVFVVTPAGDDGLVDDTDVAFPAILPNVLSVGAVSTQDIIASFSSQGHQYPDSQDPNKKPELVAPGVSLMSTRSQGAYGTISGTSQAATIVTGCLALLLEAYPQLQEINDESTIQLMKTILIETAAPQWTISNEYQQGNHHDYYGYGMIQAYDAYQALAQYTQTQ